MVCIRNTCGCALVDWALKFAVRVTACLRYDCNIVMYDIQNLGQGVWSVWYELL